MDGSGKPNGGGAYGRRFERFFKRIGEPPADYRARTDAQYFALTDSGVAKPARRFIGWPTNLSYFELRTHGAVVCDPILLREVRDAAGTTYNIEVFLRITDLRSGHELGFVEKMARARHPFDVIVEAVGNAFWDFVRDNLMQKQDVVAQFAVGDASEVKAAREQCTEAIASHLEGEFGLLVDVSMSVPSADFVVPEIVIDELSVIVSDAEDDLSVGLSMALGSDPSSAEGPQLATSPSRLKQLVADFVVSWFKGSCSLEMYCYERVRVRRLLEASVSERLSKTLGLEVRRFRLELRVPFDTEFKLEHEFAIPCEVQPGPTRLEIHHTVILERQDVAKYRASRVEDLREQVEDILRRKTKSVLLERMYAEVLVDFDSLKGRIKERVSTELERIGFGVAHFVTRPNDKDMEEVLSGELTFSVEANRFKTRDGRVDFGVSAIVRVELGDDLGDVARFLRPGGYLAKQMEQTTKEELASAIRQLNPEPLHLHFDEPMQEVEGQPSPVDVISKRVEAALGARFGVTLRSIELSPEETDLSRVNSLLCPPEPRSVSIGVDVAGSKGEDLKFTVSFRVVGVAFDEWSRFEETCRNARVGGEHQSAATDDAPVTSDLQQAAERILGSVDTMVEASAREVLKQYPQAVLTASSREIVDGLKDELWVAASGMVARELGLALSGYTFDRPRSPIQQVQALMHQQKIQDAMSSLQGARDRLRQRVSDFGIDDPEVEKLSEQIERWTDHLESMFDDDHDRSNEAAAQALRSLRGDTALPALPSRRTKGRADPDWKP
ncbi:MAG: hypothetical protein AAGA68_20280 [Pseudomonadota bacterium]